MLTDLDRKILLCLFRTDHPMTNQELALYCDAAVNTIRKEIMLLNEDAVKHGYCISSRGSAGNTLEILDQRTGVPYLRKMRSMLKGMQRMDLQYSEQVYYLARRCLCDSGNLTVEELCQELYCSRGTILRDLDLVRKIFARYHLILRNRKGGHGLVTEGSEWDIRQCLIFQHKVYSNTEGLGQTAKRDDGFKALFYMLDARDEEGCYILLEKELMNVLGGQDDFAVPMVCFPTIIHSLELCASRRKYSSEIRFTEVQAARVKDTPEEAAAGILCQRAEKILQTNLSETDITGTAMLLMCFETKNRHLPERQEYGEFETETEGLIDFLTQNGFGCERGMFDECFRKDWVCFLYRLKNRLTFDVCADKEMVGIVESQGLYSLDLCIGFGRYYEQCHGVRLDWENVMSAYYLFHRLRKKGGARFHTKNVLVISQFGFQRAEMLAAYLKRYYAGKVRQVTPHEICENAEGENEYDLLVTDFFASGDRYLESYHLPIVHIQYYPGQEHSPDLDAHFAADQERWESAFLSEESFRRVDFRTKEEILSCLADWYREDCPFYTADEVRNHLRENDAYVDLERPYSVVLVPILLAKTERQRMVVLLNRKPLIWNAHRSQIVVGYCRNRSAEDTDVINGILKRFIQITAEKASALLAGKSPLREILYRKDGSTPEVRV